MGGPLANGLLGALAPYFGTEVDHGLLERGDYSYSERSRCCGEEVEPRMHLKVYQLRRTYVSPLGANSPHHHAAMLLQQVSQCHVYKGASPMQSYAHAN